MQDGDLATSTRPHIVVVLEGVLATLTPVERRSRGMRIMRRLEVTSWNYHWHDVPMKRVATMKRRFPETAIDIVTFMGADVAQEAAQFFEDAQIPVDTIEYHPFDRFVSVLRYQFEVAMVVDSDEQRLDRYGQLGRAVLVGEDFG